MQIMEKENHQNPSKTQIIISKDQEEEEDEISLLPDCLLIDIISRLPETKEAIRTSTLSKRWQHLWPYVHNLVFIYNNFPLDKNFVSFVDKTLTQCRQSSNLHKFQFRTSFYSYGEDLYSQVNNLIRYAVSRNVQDLELDLNLIEFVLDQFIFTNSWLTRLKLDRLDEFNPTGAVCWSNLKSLSVTWVDHITEDSIQNILSGSPLLETLELKDCYGFSRIDITSKSVKNFLFSGYVDYMEKCGYDESNHFVEINAPYIVSLTIADGLRLSKFLLIDVSCLVKAHLDYEKYEHFEPMPDLSREEMLKGLILSVRHVKELKIGESCLETLARLEAKGFTFPSNLEDPNWPNYDPSQMEDASDNDATDSGD